MRDKSKTDASETPKAKAKELTPEELEQVSGGVIEITDYGFDVSQTVSTPSTPVSTTKHK